jgi:hypothetical protein
MRKTRSCNSCEIAVSNPVNPVNPVQKKCLPKPNLARHREDEGGQDDDCDQPPVPADAEGHRLFYWRKFAFDEFVVIEGIVGQIEAAGVGFFGPAGVFVSAAFGAGFGAGGNVGAAVWACFGSLRRVQSLKFDVQSFPTNAAWSGRRRRLCRGRATSRARWRRDRCSNGRPVG